VRPVEASAQFLDALAVDIESHNCRAGSRKCDRHGKPDIAETDDRNIALLHYDIAC
jgi:hypothetical protein